MPVLQNREKLILESSKKEIAETAPSTPVPVVVPVVTLPAGDKKVPDKKFKKYIEKAFKEIKLRESKYNDMMFSTPLKLLFSDIIVELVQRMVPMAIAFIEAMGSKTIKQQTIVKVVKGFLLDGQNMILIVS